MLLRAVAFGVSVSATALAVRRCGRLSDIGPRDVPLQPPDWVFGVVWPCLYATTGIAWATSGTLAAPKLLGRLRDAGASLNVATILSTHPSCLRRRRPSRSEMQPRHRGPMSFVPH